MVINRRQWWWQHTTHIKNVSFYEHNIFTAVTKDPDYVSAWISEITENINDHRLIIGLDTEWRASFRRGETASPSYSYACRDAGAELWSGTYDGTRLAANVRDVGVAGGADEW
ncbi:unnamed protein product [Lactuca virosa]|uniref:Uncharacterized protein n=1 Tax=Lactuca virosa TaxID=75947 RepID=A0AAU9NP04_9ASTR|nr:unnamed protein product [Lactuca virosa]